MASQWAAAVGVDAVVAVLLVAAIPVPVPQHHLAIRSRRSHNFHSLLLLPKNPFEECLDGIPNTKPKAWIFKSFQLLVAFQKLKFCKVVSLGIFF